MNKIPLHDKVDIIDIPNYYEFTQNKKVCMSNRVGFASRCETRKSPHFLEGIDSYAFTDIVDFTKLSSEDEQQANKKIQKKYPGCFSGPLLFFEPKNDSFRNSGRAT